MRARCAHRRLDLCGWPRRPARGTKLVLLASLSASLAGACTEQPKHRAPTEEQIHADAVSIRAHRVGMHRFKCEDGTLLLVDFRNDGMSLEIRYAPTLPPMVLTAPRQGAVYIGRGAKARMKERELELWQPDGSTRTCVRQSLG